MNLDEIGQVIKNIAKIMIKSILKIASPIIVIVMLIIFLVIICFTVPDLSDQLR